MHKAGIIKRIFNTFVDAKRQLSTVHISLLDSYPFITDKKRKQHKLKTREFLTVNSLDNISSHLCESLSTSGHNLELNVILKPTKNLSEIAEDFYDEIFEQKPEPITLGIFSDKFSNVGNLYTLITWLNKSRSNSSSKRIIRIRLASNTKQRSERWFNRKCKTDFQIHDSLVEGIVQIFVNATHSASYTLILDRVNMSSQFPYFVNGYSRRNYQTHEMLHINYYRDKKNDGDTGTLYFRRYLPANVELVHTMFSTCGKKCK